MAAVYVGQGYPERGPRTETTRTAVPPRDAAGRLSADTVTGRHDAGLGLDRRDPVKFFNYFRMSLSAFDELITVYLGTRILGIDTNMRKSITPAEKLAVTR
ncbi:hypothetical protein QTP88_017555 [Uroleucon formosanum]